MAVWTIKGLKEHLYCDVELEEYDDGSVVLECNDHNIIILEFHENNGYLALGLSFEIRKEA